MGYELIDLAGKGTLDPVNYFSYFTIDSNLIAAAVLLVEAGGSPATRTPGWVLVRGAAVVYMSVTGIVFTLLLSNPTSTPRSRGSTRWSMSSSRSWWWRIGCSIRRRRG